MKTTVDKKTICFDMDGVICEIDNDDYDLRSPIGRTILEMERHKKAGDIVIIHTGRHILNFEVTKNWLWRHPRPLFPPIVSVPQPRGISEDGDFQS